MNKIILIYLLTLLFVIDAVAQETITINIGSLDASDAQIKPHMLGVIAGPLPNYNSEAPDLTTKFQDIGITTIRNNDYQDDRLDMERMFFCGTYPVNKFTNQYPKWDCDPTDDSYYHFAESDSLFDSWVNGNFLPFFRLGGENGHLIRKHDYKGPRSYEEANWLQAGLKVVDRYNNFEGGSNTLKGYLNIWTEYPQMNFWDRDSIAFNNFWCTSFDTLKTKFPTLKIGGPGFNTSVSTSLGNNNVKTWVDLFLKEVKLRNLKPDWIGFHVFSNEIEDFYNTAINYRKLLRAESPFHAYTPIWGRGDTSFFQGTELICDAWGFDNDSTIPESTRDSLYNKQRGAAHHVGAFIALQQADIERAYLYRGGEFGPDTTLGVMGLFQGNANGAYKPVAYGFKMCSNMQTKFTKKLISPVFQEASGGSKIWTLAGEDVNGNKAILISNPSANTIHLSLKIDNNDLSTSTYSFINQFTVTDNNNGQIPNAWTSGVFVLPPFTSHLISMSNSPMRINESIKNRKLVSCYPNPTSHTLNFSEQLENVKVYNIYGQLLISQSESVKSISVEKLSNGTYFMQSNQTVLKFVVEH